MDMIRGFFRRNVRHIVVVLLVTLAGAAIGLVVGHFLGSAVVGAALAGGFAFYLTTDASWVYGIHPRTRGIGGGGLGGGA